MGKKTQYGYNADTNMLEWVQDPADTAATRTTYTYDEMFRTQSVSTGMDGDSRLSANYIYEDDLLTCIQTASSVYSFTYGDFGLRTGVYAGNHTLAEYFYTEDGNNYLEELDYGNDDKVNYTYDKQGRVTLERFEDGDTVSYSYNSNGNLATVTDSATGITTTYYYDLIDRLVKYRQTGGNADHSVTYTYDDKNNLSALTENIGDTTHTTNYAYDNDNRLESVTNGTASEHYTYDALGRASQTSKKNGDTTVLTETYSYTVPTTTAENPSPASAQIAAKRLQMGSVDMTYSYEYDGNGNIVRYSNGRFATTYEYDSANQLIRENNESGHVTYIWAYDPGGNIIRRDEYPYTTGSLDGITPTKTVNYSYGEYTWGDLLTSYDGNAITYDEIGNPLSDGTWNYTWEHGRELATMSFNGITWTYAYDADGMRTERSNGSKTYRYIYNGSSLSQMTVGTDTLYFAYNASGVPLSVTYNGTVYYYITNIHGDVIAIANASKQLVVTYSYDAWGNATHLGGSMLALEHLHHRYYRLIFLIVLEL